MTATALVLERPGAPRGGLRRLLAPTVGVKAATRFGDRDLASLRALEERTPGLAAAVLAYNGREAVQVGEQRFVVRLSLLLS